MEDTDSTVSPNKLDEALNKSKKCLTSKQSNKKSETYLDMYVKSIAKPDTGDHVSGGGTRKSDRDRLKGSVSGLNLRNSSSEEKSSEDAPVSPNSALTNGRTWKHTDVLHSSKVNRRPLHPEVNNESNSSNSNTTSPVKQEDGERFAVCPNCGSLSKVFTYCDSCQRALPKGVKTYTRDATRKSRSKLTNVISKQSFYGSSGISSVFSESKSRESVISSKHLANQPECLTISSDEDDEKAKSQANSEECISRKERMIESAESDLSQQLLTKNTEEHDDESSSIRPSSLLCRSIRIGSFKFLPPSRVQLTSKAICFDAPTVIDRNDQVSLEIDSNDIVRVMCHFGRSLPLLFIYTTPGCGGGIRTQLRMTAAEGPYYDPGSEDETQKRITLLPDKITDEQRVTLRNIFTEIGKTQGLDNKSIMYEIDSKTANEILVRSTPAEVKKMVRLLVNAAPFTTKIQTSSTGEQKVIYRPSRTEVRPKAVVKMMVYPPFPQTGGITITSEDYACLQEGEFLNDVIIDFYLRYLVQYKLTEDDRKRTHVFSSFFYRRLTQKPTRRNAHLTEDPRLSASEIRHGRVKTWTRHVDIFSKDFIIIPINENSHWFLAVICFPYLEGPTILKKKESEELGSEEESREADQSEREEIEDPLMEMSSSIQDADNQEESMDSSTQDETLCDSTVEEPNHSQNQETVVTPNPIKQPCILIFDSLAGPNRGKIVSTLREYLKVEWSVKKNSERSFDKERMKGACPRVPQQTNFSDCGIYLLQYVESFFESPIEDYSIPVRGLKDWFEDEIITTKRKELRGLIHSLMMEQHGRDLLEEQCPSLPPIYDNSESSSISSLVTKEMADLEEKDPPSGSENEPQGPSDEEKTNSLLDVKNRNS